LLNLFPKTAAVSLSILFAAALTLFSPATIAVDVELAWDASAGPDVGSYKVHWGLSSRSYSNKVDVGNTTSHTLTGLDAAEFYYIAVTAHGLDRNSQSAFSNEISLRAGHAPLGVSATSVAFSVVTVVGDTSAPQRIKLIHQGRPGDLAIEVKSTTLSAPAFSDDFDGPVTLTPGQSTTFIAAFAPIIAGRTSAMLQITHDGSNPPLAISLKGTGFTPPPPPPPPPPVAAFTGTPVTGVSPLTVAFSDASTGNISSWSWDFGDGTTSTAQNPSHIYTASGSNSYSVSLAVTSPGGSHTVTKTNYITASSGDGDGDGDGIIDINDNCPAVANPSQINTDGGAQGDACDADDDGDGVPDVDDAFPLDAGEALDTDGDGMGNDYEGRFGLNPNDPSDATLDTDGDRASNVEEFERHRNPRVNEHTVIQSILPLLL